jgi:hypothetical protein
MFSKGVMQRIIRLTFVLVMGGLSQAVVSCNDGSLVIDLPNAIVIGGHGDDECDDCGSDWWFWGGGCGDGYCY